MTKLLLLAKTKFYSPCHKQTWHGFLFPSCTGDYSPNHGFPFPDGSRNHLINNIKMSLRFGLTTITIFITNMSWAKRSLRLWISSQTHALRDGAPLMNSEDPSRARGNASERTHLEMKKSGYRGR